MNDQPTLLLPDWPAPTTVGALVTSRETGPSQGPYAAFTRRCTSATIRPRWPVAGRR